MFSDLSGFFIPAKQNIFDVVSKNVSRILIGFLRLKFIFSHTISLLTDIVFGESSIFSSFGIYSFTIIDVEGSGLITFGLVFSKLSPIFLSALLSVESSIAI